jgi:hypothetical protein
MAYVSKELKAEIAALLKTIVPKNWKYSLSVRHLSTIEFNLASSDVDFLKAYNAKNAKRAANEGYDFVPEEYGFTLHTSYFYGDERCADNLSKEHSDIIKKIFEALNLNNHNNSDYQSDYFDVGHYVTFHVGHRKPYEFVAIKAAV